MIWSRVPNERLIKLVKRGRTNEEIATLFKLDEVEIRHQIQKLYDQGRFVNFERPGDITKSIEQLNSFSSEKVYNEKAFANNLVPSKELKKHFQTRTWGEVREYCDEEIIIDPRGNYKIYLVQYKLEPNVYKIGITENLQSRFGLTNLDNYLKLVDYQAFTKNSTKRLEGAILDKVTKYIPKDYPIQARGGITEFFKLDITPTSLFDLLNHLNIKYKNILNN